MNIHLQITAVFIPYTCTLGIRRRTDGKDENAFLTADSINTSRDLYPQLQLHHKCMVHKSPARHFYALGLQISMRTTGALNVYLYS